MDTKKHTPVQITLRSHHEKDVLQAALQRYEIAVEADLERAKGFDDDEQIRDCEIRLRRINEAKWNLLGRLTEAA